MKQPPLLLLIALFACSQANAGDITGHVALRPADTAGNAKPAEDSIIFLESVPQGPAFAAAKGKLDAHPQMASKNKQFTPQILPVLEGTVVDFPNDDRILHNVFSLSKTQPFDFGLYAKGKSKSTAFPKSGLVKVFCNIHEAMVGYILVLENPFFSKADASGAFRLSGVPNGNYKLVAWHRHSSSTVSKDVILGDTREVSLKGGKDAVVEFELLEDKVGTKHKNKWGKDYKDKY